MLRFLPLALCLITWTSCELSAAPPVAANAKRLTRVFFQDDATKTVKWADLLAGKPPQLSEAREVEGFPKLDAVRQTLVQMEVAKGHVLVGVRDDDDGKFQSGWVLINTGLETADHGNHLDWNYARSPKVRATMLDDQQGNPAHLYCYEDEFYLANDQKGGFTRLAPGEIKATDDEAAVRAKAAFHQGGGGHITLAVMNHRMAYSTWIDREGPNKGRVDLTLVAPAGTTQLAGTFHLPSGGIHGATACADKIFFAPTDGVCWVKSDGSIPVDANTIEINHLDLGQDGEKPRRTGGFKTLNGHVGFVTGAGPEAALCLVNAKAAQPSVIRVPVKMAEGNRPAGLELVKPRRGNPIAVLFHDHAGDVEAPNRMSIIALDPNGDGAWTDAQLGPEFDVGASKIEGHGGHHSITFDSDRFRAIFSNPGDGTLVLFSLDDRKPIATFKVGGTPSKILAIGGHTH